MNGMRKLFCYLTAVALAVFSLPSFGAPQATGTYDLTMTSPSSLTVMATLKNVTSTKNNATISSFTYSIVSANAKINTAVITQQNPKKTGTATVAPDGLSVTVTGFFPLKPGEPAVVVTMTMFDCGANIQWNASVSTGSTAGISGGQPFSPDATTLLPITTSVACGDIACGANNVPVPNSANPGNVTVTRGFYDKDGISTIGAGECATVPYTVTTLTTAKHHFAWPTTGGGGDPAAAFEYIVTVAAPPNPTRVAWLNTTGGSADTGTPDFIAGQPCLVPPSPFTQAILPAPYGTLVADNGGTIDVDTTTPSAFPGNPNGSIAHVAVPFDIVVETERMTVTVVDTISISPNERWTVTRPVGGTTTLFPIAATPPAPLVMYTPLPIMTSTQGAVGEYVTGNQAQMCIVGQVPGVSTTLIDIGDGHSSP